MGLEDLVPDDAGEAKGGRPKEGTDGPRVASETAYRPWKHDEEYWQEVWDEHVEGEEPTIDEVADMVGYTCVFPWDLKIHIESAGIYEFDWEQMPDDYPSDDALANWLRNRGVVNEFTKKNPPSKTEKSSMFGSGSGSDESSGLMGLVENAKK